MKNKLNNIFNKKINKDEKQVFIVAEMAWAHDGSVQKAKKIIKGAADAGADSISVHITNMANYMVRDYGCTAGQTLSAGDGKEKIYDYLERINLKDSDWKKVFSFAKKSGLSVCAMPNDNKSLNLCKKLNPDIYVIASACFAEEDFIRRIAKEKKPIILRIGGASLCEIEKVVNLIKKYKNDIILLYGIQLYPTRAEGTNLRLISSLEQIFGLPVGLADHIDAESELAFIIPQLAVSMGVKIIEKHITHNRSLKGEDIEAALNPDEFKKLVEYIKMTEKALGTSYFKDLSQEELKYRNVSRKKIVAAKNIKIGEKVNKNNFILKRSDRGVSPAEIKYLIGRKTNCNIKKDEPILWEKIG